jgi:hypothetical protein
MVDFSAATLMALNLSFVKGLSLTFATIYKMRLPRFYLHVALVYIMQSPARFLMLKNLFLRRNVY